MPKLFLMRFFFILCFLISATFGFTQISKVTIQASGLTCSMCSNAINKSIRSLKYVDEVVADIKNSSFVVTFKNPNLVNFDELKNKVESAGFAVAHFKAIMHFDMVQV
ncbi:MAG: heavy-metal-associated domain-containing protein, partial [Ferruginibacter sp.]|nr:heavy-metal-associated domain-containing protein [Ferruginibacter sp.]